MAILTPDEISIISSSKKDDNSKKSIKFKKEMNIQKIFNSNNENILILSTVNCLAQFDVKNGKILTQVVME